MNEVALTQLLRIRLGKCFKPTRKSSFSGTPQRSRRNYCVSKIGKLSAAKLMKDKELCEDWLDYASQFPHQWSWFKLAQQYKNQTPEIEGRAIR